MLDFQADISGSGDLWGGALENYITESMDAIAEAARDEWVRLAQESDLTVTKDAYIEGIGEIQAPSETERKIELEGWLPNALETGIGSFDMKPGLLKGRDHVAIPMKYGAPGSTNSTPLTSQTFNRAKNLKKGERFSTKMGRSKYEGLKRDSQTKDRDSFVKFRTVSVNSPSSSWVHPGLTPLLLAEQVQSFIEQNMPNILAKFNPDQG
jgi:hypothetical protein